jgi:hypothetical protein
MLVFVRQLCPHLVNGDSARRVSLQGIIGLPDFFA